VEKETDQVNAFEATHMMAWGRLSHGEVLSRFLVQAKKGGKAGKITVWPELPDDLARFAERLGFCRPRLCRKL
jgi:hypothetical protein